MSEVAAPVRVRVRARAAGRCEYCLFPENLGLAAHEIDHIIAAKHGGGSGIDNLALCCTICNKHKGSDLSSIDPDTSEICRLFHPRNDRWDDHFRLSGGEILARSAVGRVTVRLLQLNRPERIRERETLVQAGLLSVRSSRSQGVIPDSGV